MTIQLEMWQVVTAVFTIIGFVATALKYALTQVQSVFNERRQSLSHNSEQVNLELKKLTDDIQLLEREFLNFKGDLPLNYVRREDYIRNQTIIESKLDAVASRIETLLLRGHAPHA